MLKILLITNNYTPYSGGVVSALNALVVSLQSQGHEIMLVTLDFIADKHCDPVWVRRIPSVFRFRYKHNHMAIPWRAAHYLEQWMREFAPDVVHLHHPFLLGPIAVACAKKLGIRTVFTYHTMYEKYAHYVPVPGSIVGPIIDKRVRLFCASVDHVVVPSRGIKQRVLSMGISQITVIPSGLQELFLKEPFNAKKLAPPYQLLYVGRLVIEKNIPFLLEVIKLLPDDYRLALVGYGSQVEYLKNFAYHDLGLAWDRVRFIIDPPKQELLNYYRAAHIFLFASQTDTQGLVLAESMACSMPVIALNGIGQADCIENGVNGYLVENKQEMVQAIIDLCNNPERYGLLQRGAYKTTARYNQHYLVAQLEQVYQGD